jgi:TetR/AcrR family transcriptional repressor of uid operon
MIPAENLPGEPSSERESSRRTRVLAAAERAFARQGFHAATMQDVAAEARMSF